MRLRAPFPVAAAASLLLACEPATTATAPAVPESPARITNGELAGATYPAVVLVLMEVAGQPAFRCSGTLIAPTLVLTAGHCTGAPREFSGMRVFTESDVDSGTRAGTNKFPYAGPNSIEARDWHTHPQYTSAAFFRHDVGVIELAAPVQLAASDYGRLPAVDQLDVLKPRRQAVFTAVGYGLQRINPAHVEAQRVRMVAEPHLLQINTGFTGAFSLLLSNNAATGGTCFGDSGGPNFLGASNVVAGVTSFAINGTCGGTGGVFRMDRPDVLSFVTPYLVAAGGAPR